MSYSCACTVSYTIRFDDSSDRYAIRTRKHDHGWGSVEKEDFDALMKRVTDLETENRALKKEVEQMESRLDAVDTTCEAGCDQAMRDLGFSGGSKKGAKKSDVEKAGAVAIAGLIAALVALNGQGRVAAASRRRRRGACDDNAATQACPRNVRVDLARRDRARHVL